MWNTGTAPVPQWTILILGITSLQAYTFVQPPLLPFWRAVVRGVGYVRDKTTLDIATLHNQRAS